MGRGSGLVVPAETARVAWAACPKGTPAMVMRDRLRDLPVDDDLVDEVERLQVSLDAAAANPVSINRRSAAEHTSLTDLGIAVIRDHDNATHR